MIASIEEVAKAAERTARGFFDALKDQPLSIALVVMNFTLLFFLYSAAIQRKDTVNAIIAWQEKTDALMANCVSKEVVETIVTALERQLLEMRKQLRNNGAQPEPAPMPRPRPAEPAKPPEPTP